VQERAYRFLQTLFLDAVHQSFYFVCNNTLLGPFPKHLTLDIAHAQEKQHPEKYTCPCWGWNIPELLLLVFERGLDIDAMAISSTLLTPAYI